MSQKTVAPPSEMFLSSRSGFLLMPEQDALLPTLDPFGRALTTLAARMEWLGFIAIDEIIRAKESRHHPRVAKLSMTRHRGGTIMMRVDLKDIPSSPTAIRECFVCHDKYVVLRICGSPGRPSGLVKKADLL